MPYKIEPNDKTASGPFKVINEDTNEAVGEHASWEKAIAHLKALCMNMPDADKAQEKKAVEVLAEIGYEAAFVKGVLIATKGGSGSDNFGHHGRPGEVGGSADEGGGGGVGTAKPKPAVAKVDMNDEEEDAEKSLNFSYIKSIGIDLPDDQMIQKFAVKYVAKDQIKGYTFLWGDPKNTDIEADYFTKATNFWDDKLSQSQRPLTWDHAQDKEFKASPLIGAISEFGDDDVGRWYVAKLDRSHRYRKAIDKLIEQRKLGTSSDSAPQYVRRVQTGKSNWLQEWPWFASALTDAPAEPRMIGNLEFFKSIGISLQPDAQLNAWKLKKLQRQKFTLMHKT